MNKFICTGLAILMILSFAAPVCAVTAEQTAEAQGLITPQFTHIMFIDAKLSITPIGEAICRGAVTLYSSSQTADLTVELQKQNGNDWTPIRSWTASGPGLPGVEIERSYYVVRGTYRVCTTAKARSSSGMLLEEVSIYSAVLPY